MPRIDKLTPKQIERFAEFRQEWLDIGLSIEPADRERAEAGVRLAYAAAKLAPPRFYVWLRSPLEGSYGAAIVAHGWSQVGNQVRDQVGDQVDGQVYSQVDGQVYGQVADQVRGQVYDQVYSQVGGQVAGQVADQVYDQVYSQVYSQVYGQVYDQVRDQVYGQVAAQVRGQVADQVRGQVADQVRGQVADQVRGQVRDQVWRSLWGQHDAAWLSFYDYFGRACGLGCVAPLRGMMEIARSAGWWWALSGVAILTERPTVLYRDEQFRLHNPTAAAILYPDGFGVWVHHGVRVPERVIVAPERLTADDVFGESNVEVRRVMIERAGADRLIAMTPRARELHADADQLGLPRRLLRLEFDDDEPIVMVELANSTPEPDGSRKKYMLRVPPGMRRCGDAVAWTFGMDATEYAPAVES